MRIDLRLGLVLLLLAASSSPGAASGGKDTEKFTLGIFGNANMDNTIDGSDISYVQGVISGTNALADLSDANHDGKVDEKDIDQIKRIIDGSQKELTILDSAKRIVTIKMPVERIIVLSEYQAEAIRMLGAMDKVVGVSSGIKDDTVYFPDLSEVSSVGIYPGDLETIITLNPDIVLGNHGKAFDDLLPMLENSSKGTFQSIIQYGYIPKDNQMIAELEQLGYILDKRDGAQHYIEDFYFKYIDYIRSETDKLSKDEKPDIYAGGNSGKGLYYPFPRDGAASQMIGICGGNYILSDLTFSGEIDPEAVVARDPAIIIQNIKKADAGYKYDNSSNLKTLWEETTARPELAKVKAVQDKNVHIMDNGLNFGYDLPVAAAYYAKWIHPELFKDLDPRAVHQEYLRDFQGLDYDLNEHGTFVFP